MKKKKKTGKKIGSQKLAKKKSWQNRKKKKLAKNWLAILANFPTSVFCTDFASNAHIFTISAMKNESKSIKTLNPRWG